MDILLLLLGIIGIVINANGWIIIPQLAINICFAVAILAILVKFITIIRVGGKF